MRIALPADPAWSPNDPNRSCYTCGSAPTRNPFNDGSPAYACWHEPVRPPDGWTAVDVVPREETQAPSKVKPARRPAKGVTPPWWEAA